MEVLLGMDIGGVNVKASSVPRDRVASMAREARSTKVHYPLWKHSVDELPATLERIIVDHAHAYSEANHPPVLTIAVSITGELSDAFISKRDGIVTITRALTRAFTSARDARLIKGEHVLFVSSDGTLRNEEEAVRDHRLVAAANWHATATWAGNMHPDCVFMDCGSTTTDIIPVIGGTPVPAGRTDMDRLRTGELVYTGALRPTIPSIAHRVPVDGELVPLSFETFALMADVHLLLGHVTAEHYDCDTADGRTTSKLDAMRRVARIVCEDLEIIGEENVMTICHFLHGEQVASIERSLEMVMDRLRRERGINPGDERFPCVLTGLGAPFLARQAAITAGASKIIEFPGIAGTMANVASSSLGVVHVLANFLNGVDSRVA